MVARAALSHRQVRRVVQPLMATAATPGADRTRWQIELCLRWRTRRRGASTPRGDR